MAYLAVSAATVSESVFHKNQAEVDSHLHLHLRNRQNSNHCSGLADSMVAGRHLQVAVELEKEMLTVRLSVD